MKVLYISPNGQINKRIFPLVNIEQTTNPNDADYCFMEVNSSPAFYDVAPLDINKSLPLVCFDNREYGPMQKEDWSPIDDIFAARSIDWVPLHPIIYFVRNMDKTKEYPPNVHPYDWPYFEECDFPPVTKDELFNRPFDCCLTSVASPTREQFVNSLFKDGRLKTYFEFRDHTERIQHKDWINEYRMCGKCFINCDGGGFTDERIQQLFSLAVILKNKNNHRPNNPFTDKVNCIEISEHPTKEELDWLVKIVNDKEWLYEIYLNGIAHVKKYYSKEYLSEYVQRIIHEKENSQATKEDVGGVSVQ